ncbi:MAG: hypothetical protein AAFP77_29485 [Bacteroidota bacterium]
MKNERIATLKKLDQITYNAQGELVGFTQYINDAETISYEPVESSFLNVDTLKIILVMGGAIVTSLLQLAANKASQQLQHTRKRIRDRQVKANRIRMIRQKARSAQMEACQPTRKRRSRQQPEIVITQTQTIKIKLPS